MGRKILKGDKYIWGAYFALCFISIVAMFSASGTLTFNGGDPFDPIMKHSLFLAIGGIIVFVTHRIPYRWFRLFGFAVYVVSLILLMYALIGGNKVNEAARWVTIAGFQIQPSELAKMGLVMMVALVLAMGQQKDKTGVSGVAVKRVLIIAGVTCLLIFPENFSTAALLGFVVLCMMMIGGVKSKTLVIIVAVVIMFVAGVLSSAHFLDKSKKEGAESSPVEVLIHRANTWNGRIASFFEHSEVPDYRQKTSDENYQEHHARMAIAHSHGVGVGPGNSRERDFLPQAYADYIYCIIIEEYGILGGVVVLFLYLSILFRALVNANKCSKAYPAILILGLGMIVVLQAIINMCVATGVIPVTGQTLPLISRGGSSILITSCYFGMMLSISRYAKLDKREILATTEREGALHEEIAATNPNN